jgi:transketolase
LKNEELRSKAAQIRQQVLEMAITAGKGHVPPAFSWMEIGVALFYGGVLRYNPANPTWSDRDRFILSKGHGCLTLYAILADKGFFPSAELMKFASPGALLPGHPDIAIPGVEAVSGSLGHGLGIGCGMALSARLDQRTSMVFVVLGDGECDEGSVWEAAMFAGHAHLQNLVAIVDRNGLSATDFTENVLALEPLDQRWRSFGWDVTTADGHSIDGLISVLSTARSQPTGHPRVLIANTVKGKGVGFMENSPDWHHRLPKGDAVGMAFRELGKK